MPRFYQIVRLTAGRTIFPDAQALRVDLDGVTPQDLIENDVAFRAAAAPDAWFWLSGGGTLFLNGRYLPVVQRSPGARVNPGKFSLFTGRADNAAERVEPAFLVRELFEELLLYESGTLLAPKLAAAQAVIDTTYSVMRQAGIVAPGPSRELALTPVALPTRPVVIRHQGWERTHHLAWIATANNDINALSVFAAECDIARLTARDGEFHVDGGTVTPAGRAIFLYDLQTRTARPLSGPGEVRALAPEDTTVSLAFLLAQCSAISGNG